MLFIVSKTLQPLLWPLNLAMLLILAGLFLWNRGGRAGFRCVLAAFFLLYWTSMPVFFFPMRHAWENTYPPRPIDEYPNADAIVVLGGTVTQPFSFSWGPEENSGSRLLGAARLYKRGKADTVVVSGGVAYKAPSGEMRVEADDMRDLLIELGVPGSAIIRENQSRNTYENAVHSAKILHEKGKSRVLLVTSAFHEKRAVDQFRRQGLEVTAVPTSFATWSHHFNFKELLPDAGSLEQATLFIKEVVGYIVYKFVH